MGMGVPAFEPCLTTRTELQPTVQPTNRQAEELAHTKAELDKARLTIAELERLLAQV
jgi:hypothetical protein